MTINNHTPSVHVWFNVIIKLNLNSCIVLIGVRNPKGSQTTVEEYLKDKKKSGNIFYEKLDIGDTESVRKFAAVIQGKYKKIDLLVNNGKCECC